MGKIPNLTNMFQLGWNHQLVKVEGCFYSSNLECLHDLKWRFKIASKHGNLEQVENPQIIKPSVHLVIYTSYILILYVKSLMMCLYMCIYAFRLCDGERFPWEEWPNLQSKGVGLQVHCHLKTASVFFTSANVNWSGWWFQIFFMFTPTWGDDPIWLIRFKGAETTNQDAFPTIFPPPKKKFLWTPPPKKKCAQKATHFSNPTKKHG